MGKNVHSELGRVSLQASVFCTVINYWLENLETEQTRYFRYAYQLMLSDLEKKAKRFKLGIKTERFVVKLRVLPWMVKSRVS